MTTTRLSTPRPDALGVRADDGFERSEEQCVLRVRKCRQMAVFGIAFPTPNPAIAVKGSLPQTFLDISGKQAERAASRLNAALRPARKTARRPSIPVAWPNAFDDGHRRRFPRSVDVAGPDKGSVVVLLGAAQHAPVGLRRGVPAAAHRVAADHRHRPRSTADRQVGRRHPRRARRAVGPAGRRSGRWRAGVGARRDPAGPVHRPGRDRPRPSAGRRPDRRDPRRALPAGGDEHHRAGQHARGPCRGRASQRFVYGDFRLVELLARRNAQESTAQLAAEIVLRTSTW